EGATVVAELPVHLLTDDAPVYERPRAAPPPPPTVDPVTLPIPLDLGTTLLTLLGSPNVGSRAAIFSQYDHTVQASTVVPPGRADAAVLRVRGSRQGLALTIDSAARYAALDPRRGAALAVAEAARNLSCGGAEPLAATDCLNLANPERPAVAGALPDVALAVDAAFQAEGDRVLLLGSRTVGFGGSEYAAVVHGHTGGPAP